MDLQAQHQEGGSMGLSNEQITLIEASFAQVAPMSGLAAELFYARLFAIAPELQTLFKGDMTDQGAKLMKTLALAVNSLRDLDAVAPALKDLAARHVTYGVTPAMYTPVGEALIDTLASSLDEAFDDPTREAWVQAYTVMAQMMVDSAYPRADRKTVAAE